VQLAIDSPGGSAENSAAQDRDRSTDRDRELRRRNAADDRPAMTASLMGIGKAGELLIGRKSPTSRWTCRRVRSSAPGNMLPTRCCDKEAWSAAEIVSDGQPPVSAVDCGRRASQ
jgi:hypothetical protein